MTVRNASEKPAAPKPFTGKELADGYRRLDDGFQPGSVGDPCHRGEKYYGGSYEYNPDGSRTYRPKGRY